MASFGASIVAVLAPYVSASDEFGMSVKRHSISDVIQSVGLTLDVSDSVIRSGSRTAVRISAGYSHDLPAEIVVILALRVLKLPMLDQAFFKSLHASIRDLAFHRDFAPSPKRVSGARVASCVSADSKVVKQKKQIVKKYVKPKKNRKTSKNMPQEDTDKEEPQPCQEQNLLGGSMQAIPCSVERRSATRASERP